TLSIWQRCCLSRKAREYQSMTNDHNEQSEHSPEITNPFIARKLQREAREIQFGLGDIGNPWDRDAIQRETEKRIEAGRITDEPEKHKVFEEVKKQRKEYNEYLENQRVPESTPKDTEKSESPSDEAEYRRGYDNYMQSKKRDEEQQRTPYQQGMY